MAVAAAALACHEFAATQAGTRTLSTRPCDSTLAQAQLDCGALQAGQMHGRHIGAPQSSTGGQLQCESGSFSRAPFNAPPAALSSAPCTLTLAPSHHNKPLSCTTLLAKPIDDNLPDWPTFGALQPLQTGAILLTSTRRFPPVRLASRLVALDVGRWSPGPVATPLCFPPRG